MGIRTNTRNRVTYAYLPVCAFNHSKFQKFTLELLKLVHMTSFSAQTKMHRFCMPATTPL